MSNGDTKKDREPTERVCVRLPMSMVRKVHEIAGPYRDQTSIIKEIIGEYLKDREVREKEQIAQDNERYQILLRNLRRDLGLPDQPSDSD